MIFGPKKPALGRAPYALATWARSGVRSRESPPGDGAHGFPFAEAPLPPSTWPIAPYWLIDGLASPLEAPWSAAIPIGAGPMVTDGTRGCGDPALGVEGVALLYPALGQEKDPAVLLGLQSSISPAMPRPMLMWSWEQCATGSPHRLATDSPGGRSPNQEVTTSRSACGRGRSASPAGSRRGR